MTWVAIVAAILLFVIVTAATIALFRCRSVERQKQHRLAAIRARSLQARFEIDQATLGFHRAMSDAVARYQRDRHS